MLLERDECADCGPPVGVVLAPATESLSFEIFAGTPGVVGRVLCLPVNESTLLSRDLDLFDDATLLFALLARDDSAEATDSSDNPRACAPRALLAGDNGLALWRGDNGREPPVAAPFSSRAVVFRPGRVGSALPTAVAELCVGLSSPAASWCTTDAWRTRVAPANSCLCVGAVPVSCERLVASSLDFASRCFNLLIPCADCSAWGCVVAAAGSAAAAVGP